MTINDKILDLLNKHNGIVSAADVVSLGFSRNLLSVYVRNGLLTRVKHGYYSLTDTIEDDMYTLSLGCKNIVFSHESALFLNGISERTPFEHTVTIPNNTSLAAKVRDKCKCHYVNPDVYELGIITRKTVFGNEVRCYNAERTICDLIKAKNKIDIETLTAGIKNYAASKDKNIAQLGTYAAKLNVLKEVQMYMGVLL